MKQNMKRVLLALCMITCLFSLAACSKKSEAEELDAMTAAGICQAAEGMLESFTTLTPEEMALYEKNWAKNKENVFLEGLSSWKNIQKDTGDFVSIISSTAEEADNGYIGTVQAEFTKRQVEYKLYFTSDLQDIKSMSFSPEYTIPEKMVKAAMNTLMGMGTVFAVLIFISFLIGCFKYISVFEQKIKGKANDQVTEAAPAPAPLPVAEVYQEEELVDDLELVAVITAAIAAAEGTVAEGLVVRSIKRAPASKWKRA